MTRCRSVLAIQRLAGVVGLWGWTKLETSNVGFPDLAIGGAGFCEAVYRWNGTTYQHDHNQPTEPGGCVGIG